MKTNVTLQAKTQLAATGVFICSAAVGLWTALVVGWWLFQWSEGQALKLILAMVLWPLAWLICFVIIVELTFALSAVLSWLFKLPHRFTSRLVTIFILASFSWVAYALIRYPDCAGSVLGWSWFIGLGLSFVARLLHWLGPCKIDIKNRKQRKAAPGFRVFRR